MIISFEQIHLDFVHLLTSQGIPSLSTSHGQETSSPIFLAARLLVALGLLAIALLPWEHRAPVAVRYCLSIGCIAFAVVMSWWGLVTSDLQELTLDRGGGQRILKTGVEYAG